MQQQSQQAPPAQPKVVLPLTPETIKAAGLLVVRCNASYYCRSIRTSNIPSSNYYFFSAHARSS